MDEDRKKEMEHEDNSFLTKFAVLSALLLVSGIIAGCLFMVWQVIKFFMNWF